MNKLDFIKDKNCPLLIETDNSNQLLCDISSQILNLVITKVEQLVLNKNVIFVNPSNTDNILLNDIEIIHRDIKFHHSEKRLYIINCAERMNNSVANSLLKAIEEPPENCWFVLVTQNIHQILQTIKSRCMLCYISYKEKSNIVEYIQTSHSIQKINNLCIFDYYNFDKKIQSDVSKTRIK